MQCPKCGSPEVNHSGQYHCWDCSHEWGDPLPPQLTGPDRIIRILEDGWLIFQKDGNVYIRIDDRDDEPIDPLFIRHMVHEGILTPVLGEVQYGESVVKKLQSVTIFELTRGPESEITLRFKSKSEKDYFLSQLLGGWGEDLVQTKWVGPAYEATSFDVINTDDSRPERRKSY